MKCRWGMLGLAAAMLVAGADINYNEAQQILKEKGYYTGAVDGLDGPQTQAAIVAFQRDHGLKTTGTLDDTTAKHLKDSVSHEALDTMKGAGKEAGSAAAAESKSALGEMKSVFKGGKKQ